MATTAKRHDEVSGTRRTATPAEVRAMANPLRLRIIRETLDGELTNAEIAERVGRDKATVLHHVRVLLETGFLEELPVRRGTRGSREKPYRGTGKSWTLSVSETPGMQDVGDAMLGAFLEEVAAARDREEPDLTRAAIRLTAEEREEFTTRLHDLIDEFAQRRKASEGDAYAVFTALYRR